MAQLFRGTTVASDTTVTAQTLHNLIENALVSGIGASDLIAGTHFIFVGTTQPNPSNFPLWYNPDPEDPVLRCYAPPFNIFLAVGPDRFEIPLLNSAATTVAMGCLVAANGASDFILATSPSLNAIGFAQATIAAGAWGPVCTYGIGYVLHISSPSCGTQTQGPTAGDGLRAYGCPAGGVYGNSIGSDGGSGPFFGMFLESNRSGASGSFSRFRSMIWGPRLTIAP